VKPSLELTGCIWTRKIENIDLDEKEQRDNVGMSPWDHDRTLGGVESSVGGQTKRGPDFGRDLPVSAGHLALTRSVGAGGAVRIGQAAIQHFTKVIWVVSKNLKWERPYAAPASCRAGAAIDGGFENVLAFCCYCIT
jgi:hypothetical protein